LWSPPCSKVAVRGYQLLISRKAHSIASIVRRVLGGSLALKYTTRQFVLLAMLLDCIAVLCASSTDLANDETRETESERAQRIEYIQKAIKGDVSPVPGRKMVSAGTGFYVAHQTILTNRHVVEACAAVTIRGTDGKNVVSTLVAADKGQDLALIKA